MNNISTRPFAVVTGASSGIGYELAKIFAENGYDLLITSNSDRINQAAETVRSMGAQVETLKTDLASYDGVEKLYETIRKAGRPLEAIAMNAGVGVGGDFTHQTDLEAELNLINLNVVAPVHLTKRIAKDMVGAGQGRILFTSSIAGDMPGPYEAVYAASKAFLTSFGQAIRNELKDTGVSITLLMPGPTETDFFHRADMLDTKVGAGEKDDAADVARDGFKAMMEGKDHVIGGSIKNTIQSVASNVLPDPVVAGIHRNMAEPGSAQK